ncbi:UDP-N-acetylmuramoyl-L-alanyl-D-glutamate--2,6-diaminopimelate ligase [Laedolimicola ammoniilytica]|uniref:UDP-N-acetylmuramoyl-L-alanyl-D-glutamate--2,6-diaminopimelate ligase n=1 Tax=Laedolimicola ammoniilytica TaxID=2981771 RepID=A0ABT2RVT2_9FIRM|nr:UDP-N-acetylmuramoyl-L-alanyl-D-glutamate--2,6-diaminopimelate ligase [Laedolimicola ammoniilytica]MCC2825344.1 UDP-N-acetylmuramoyl-L-alanyl-D-glutamate--2,6-diaminopimelate ligase [Faecalicatena orotica]MCU6696419.1 UDP-N-acetylmuramoyl-L-alanyl-D-glutamate--2,6-diaminopimelate ligase [Laedolimicola ammoniilytica]SCH66841.1 UDP-N-acetylmuramoyl-L-alanyl-D-glutamate--2%2C6-diaminopimelate ligase [uncultured Clostridium sp.]
MRAARELLKDLKYEVVSGSIDVNVSELVYNTRKVKKECMFVCIKGATFDSHDVAGEAAKNGAVVIVAERPVDVPAGTTVVLVEDTRYALALISAAYFQYPAKKLKVIGITGTKGKTTTTFMIRSILEHAGIPTGLIGTIEVIIGDRHIPAHNTTPESYEVQEYFAQMVEAGCKVVVMEVSSQGLKLHRTAGIQFDIGIFTNLAPDHIGENEHASFEEYMECKSRLFRQCDLGLVNVDDAHCDDILQGHTCKVETYGFSEKADLRASDLKLVNRPGFLGVDYHVSGLMDFDVEIDMPGRFSVYNSLVAIAVCRHFDIPKEDMLAALEVVQTKGRIEKVKVSDDFTLMIDYAHNAMSLESLLTTLKEYNPKRLVCLFGCGGNRSKLRRYEMGEVSGNLADLTVITSDNPRFEEPQAIIDDIKIGIGKTSGKYVEIIDRKEAIRYVIEHGQPGDVIVLAGKGHEDYQEICGVKHPMDERVLIAEVLEELGRK